MHNTMTPIFIAHATVGCAMLVSGMTAMLAKKANKTHRMAGKIYAVATTLVGITGLTIAIEKSNQFLIATSIFVLYMMVSGYRSLYLKRLYKEKKAAPLDWIIIGVSVPASLFLIYMGMMSVINSNYGGLVPLVFGGLSLRFNISDIKKFTKGPDDKKHWLYNHISRMAGSYIAGLTAFLAVNAGFLGNTFSLAVWLSPTIIGTPLIIRQIRKYKGKENNSLGKELGIKIKVPADTSQ